jgi:hypothetical protein
VKFADLSGFSQYANSVPLYAGFWPLTISDSYKTEVLGSQEVSIGLPFSMKKISTLWQMITQSEATEWRERIDPWMLLALAVIQWLLGKMASHLIFPPSISPISRPSHT